MSSSDFSPMLVVIPVGQSLFSFQSCFIRLPSHCRTLHTYTLDLGPNKSDSWTPIWELSLFQDMHWIWTFRKQGFCDL